MQVKQPQDLTNLSPLDGRYRPRLDKLRDYFSEYGLMCLRLEVELRWLTWLSDQAEITELDSFSETSRCYIDSLILAFDTNEAALVKKIEEKTRHDVKAIELYIREKLSASPAPEELSRALSFIHVTCTSEDINNLAYALMVSRASRLALQPCAEQVLIKLDEFGLAEAGAVMSSRTHGQLASPSTWGKEMSVFSDRMVNALEHWYATPIRGKFNGSVGNYNAHAFAWPHVNWPRLCRRFVESLGLEFNECTTQIEPGDWLVRWLNELTLFNLIALDLSRDMWGYVAIGYLRAKIVSVYEVGSSTMPHKVNPIDFENAEGNLGIAIGAAQTLAREIPVSRWQRDLSGSTRMRNLSVVAGHSLLAWQSIVEGLERVDVDAVSMSSQLSDHYELLGEALQTELRRHGIVDAYEQIKSRSHGKVLDETTWQELVNDFEFDDASREKLSQLTPETYTGLASRIIENSSARLKSLLKRRGSTDQS